MDKKTIYVLEDYSYGLVCASHDVNYMKQQLREKYFTDVLPYEIHDQKARSKSDKEFEENLLELIQEDMRMIEEYLEIVDCAYVCEVPIMEEEQHD